LILADPADRSSAGCDRPPQRPVLRLVLAVSLDGRLAPAAGGAARIGGPGDRRVLEEALAWADGCLIGAETLRLHGGTCLIHAAGLLAARSAAGRSPQPVAIAVSRSGLLPPELAFFRQPLQRWLLRPPAPSGIDPGGPPEGFHRLLPLGNWFEALSALAGLGLRRIVVLGGAQLAADLLQHDQLDELQLTLCPLLLGGGHPWLPLTALPPDPPGSFWQLLEHRPLGGGELLLHYRRIRQAMAG
jgi:5-amino-6-(5-phosphoribosylamino)uracil reductase